MNSLSCLLVSWFLVFYPQNMDFACDIKLKLDKSSKQTTRCQFKIVNYPQKRVNQPPTPIWRNIKQMLASCHLLPVSKLQPIWLWPSPMLGIFIDLLHKNIYNCFQEILKDCMKFCLTIRHNLDPV